MQDLHNVFGDKLRKQTQLTIVGMQLVVTEDIL